MKEVEKVPTQGANLPSPPRNDSPDSKSTLLDNRLSPGSDLH